MSELDVVKMLVKGAAEVQREIDAAGLGNPDKLEIKRLQAENARLRELLKESKRQTKRYKQGAWIVEEHHTWTDEDIDRRLRNGRED